MGRQPADPRRKVAQKVEGHHAHPQPPPVAFRQHRFIDPLTIPGDKPVKIIAQRLVKHPVVDDQIGFQIQRQAERIEVARPDGGPVVVREGDFAMQRTAAIFVDLHAAFDEVVVEQVGAELHNRNIRFALTISFTRTPRRAALRIACNRR